MNARISPLDAFMGGFLGLLLTVAVSALLVFTLPAVARGGWQVSQMVLGDIRR